MNIEFSEHHILAQNRTSNMSNITKNRTVREHRTVHSKTTNYTIVGQKNCCSGNSRLHYHSLFSILCRRRSCWKCCVLFLPSSLAWHISWKKTWNNSIQKVLSYLPTIYLCTLDKLFKSVCVATLTVFFPYIQILY